MARMVSRLPLLPAMHRVLQPTTRWLRERGRGVTRADAHATADRVTKRIDAWFDDATSS